MERKSITSQIIKIASLFAIVLAIAFTLPPSAHANMVHNTSDSIYANNSQQGTDQTTIAHDTQIEVVECGIIHEKSGDSYESGVQCCSGMHTSALALIFGVMPETEEVHSHFALPQSQMASAFGVRLIRPPRV